MKMKQKNVSDHLKRLQLEINRFIDAFLHNTHMI